MHRDDPGLRNWVATLKSQAQIAAARAHIISSAVSQARDGVHAAAEAVLTAKEKTAVAVARATGRRRLKTTRQSSQVIVSWPVVSVEDRVATDRADR
jgi:hypothetical protein